MKRTPEYVEGQEAWTRFDALVGKVMSTPHATIQRGIEAERAASLQNPNRRGPKPKRKPRASPGPGVQPHV
jgi:hypothetical protein